MGPERVPARQRKREPWQALEKGSNNSRGFPSEVTLQIGEEGLRVGEGERGPGRPVRGPLQRAQARAKGDQLQT